MAKITILFLLFALVAICSASRITREEPKADTLPKTFEELKERVDHFFQTEQLQAAVQKAFSQENMDKFKQFAESFGEQGKDLLAKTQVEFEKLKTKQ